jgi:cytochrome c-type biogenesis protein CcmE
MTPRRKRLYVVLGILGGVAASVALAVMASRENIMFYYDPSQIAAGQAPVLKRGALRASREIFKSNSC